MSPAAATATDSGQRIEAAVEPTGALDTATLHQQLSQRLAQRRTDAHVAIAMLDIDHFGRFDDSHGHGAGAAVLRGIVERLRPAIGPDGLVGPVGGDAVAVVVETRDATPERWRQQLSAALSGGHWMAKPNVTIGVVLAAPGEDALEVIRRAGDATHQAKRRRRAPVLG